jgi:hypothetical protein
MALGRITSFEEVSSWLESHQQIWGLDEFQMLGRFHALIDTADQQFWRQVNDEIPGDIGNFKRLELTSFGREVSGDSPRWWVFAGEPDVGGLWSDTKLAFLSAQTLLHDAEKMSLTASSYDALLIELTDFLRRHRHELQALASYGERLSAKNELAPAILYSYSVWGSTRRADRSLDEYKGHDHSAKIRLAGELALGLRQRTAPSLFWAYVDLLDQAAEASSDDEYLSVSADDVLRVGAQFVRRELLTYFAELRDSCRHIDSLCQEFVHRETIYADDRFVKQFITKISTQPATVETDLWDIKETLDMWSCPPERKAAATVTFAEDVAAFANSRGGMLLIGIADDTHAIVGVDDAENRIKHMHSVLRARIDCPADFIRVRAVQLPVSSALLSCLIVVVGRTSVPVGVRQVNDSYSYPLRVGPGIGRVSRNEVATTKAHMKGTSFAFAADLATWVLA